VSESLDQTQSPPDSRLALPVSTRAIWLAALAFFILTIAVWYVAALTGMWGVVPAPQAVRDALHLFTLVLLPFSLVFSAASGTVAWLAVRFVPGPRAVKTLAAGLAVAALFPAAWLLGQAPGIDASGLVGFALASPFTAWNALTVALPSAAVVGYAAFGSRLTAARLIGVGVLACLAGMFLFVTAGVLTGAETD